MTERRPAALTETIATYDAIAHRYAQRFAVTDQPRLRDAFRSLLEGPAAVVLDAGCGPGLGCRRLAAAGLAPIGLDLSAGMLLEARALTRAPLVRSDLCHLPLADHRVAGVWCNAALVHLGPAAAGTALDEFGRVVHARGALFVSVCVGDGDEWLTGPSGRRRWFQHHDGEWLVGRIHAAGFDVVATEAHVDAAGSWSSIVARRR